MPTTHSTDKYSNGYDFEVAEPPRSRSDRNQREVKTKKNWIQSVADWKIIIATVFAPTVCAFLLWLLPSFVFKGDLNTVKMEAASALGVATTGLAGQIKETKAELNGKIDALSASLSERVDGIEKTVDRTQSGVEELLRRSAQPSSQSEAVTVKAATKATPASPPPPPTRRIKKVEKKNDASLLGWIAR